MQLIQIQNWSYKYTITTVGLFFIIILLLFSHSTKKVNTPEYAFIVRYYYRKLSPTLTSKSLAAWSTAMPTECATFGYYLPGMPNEPVASTIWRSIARLTVTTTCCHIG